MRFALRLDFYPAVARHARSRSDRSKKPCSEMSTSPGDRAVWLAGRLLELGISKDTVFELMSYPPDQVEAQLNFLSFRNVKRPGGFLVSAIRRNYALPKGFYYANVKSIREQVARSRHGRSPVEPR